MSSRFRCEKHEDYKIGVELDEKGIEMARANAKLSQEQRL